VSSKHSRKSFFTHLLGVLAAVGIAPRLLAKTQAETAAQAGGTPFKIQAESRAVVRSADVR
jgi:hypothetical protein